MPWKFGGNFEIVATKCETNWKECVIAIVNYIWCEMVSDVVDYLGKEGMILILIVIITSTILLRMKYHKKTRMQNVVLNKQILSKVGYKIHDLELKINVLTYKMQYGTWPLPHQIYSLNPRKLQKIKMTLSNPGDYKSWINHVLLSPMKNSMCVPYPNTFGPSEVKLTDFSDIKGKRTRHIEYNGLTDCSSIEMSKSTSDQSVNSHSQAADMYSRNASTRESDCSKSGNFTLPQQNTRFQPSVPNEIEGRFSKTSSTEKHVTSSMVNAKCSPYQEFTDIVHKCKSFLKKLQCNDRHLHPSKSSSKTSDTCPLKQSIASLATQNENASHDNQVTTVKKEINETRCAKEINNSETIENGGETYGMKHIPNAVVSTTSNDNAMFSKEFCRMTQPVRNVQSSQETLHEVKRKLQSLHNVLQAYQDASRSSEQEESKRNERLDDETDASIVPIEIEDADRCKTDTNCNVDSQKNPRELDHWMDNCEYFDHSGGFNLSSLTECSNTSKIYWCPSNDATRHSCSKESNHCAAHRSVERPSDLPTSSMATKLSDCEQPSRFYSFSTLRISEDCTNCEDEYEEDACRRNVADHTHRSDAHAKINKNVTNANNSLHLEDKISDTVSERICCILSSKSFKDENTQTQNLISSRSVEIFDNGEQKCQENAIVSQSDDQMSEKCQRNATSRSGDRTSNSNDEKEKSTALLLQEALHFKKILLTQIDSAQGQPTQRGTNENDIANHEDSREYKKTQQRENNDDFPSTMLDIKTEEPVIEDSCEQTNYIYLEMKQRRDPFLRSKKLNTLARHESEEKSQDRSCKQSSSKYFSVPDVAIRDDNNDDNVKIESNVLSSLKPPIYEKMISIMIPIDVRKREEIEIAKDKNEKSLQTNDAVAGYIWTRTNSLEDSRGNKSIDDNIIGRLPMTRKFEDLVLERIRNIRDYMDKFLRNQNEAISKVRRALQYRGENDAMLAPRCSNETSHIMLHKHLIAISNRDNSMDQAISLSNDSSDPLLKAWPNCRSHEVLLDDDVLKYCSSICLRKNPEMFALITPIKNEFSDKSDVRSSETTAKLEKKGTNSSMTFKHSYEKDAKLTHKITNLDEPYQENQKKNQVNKQMIADTQEANSQKHQYQREMQDAENKSSAISSRYSLGAETDTKIIEITRKKLPAISNNNSTSNSSSYFTTATVSSMKMDDAFSKSTLNSEQSVSIVQKKRKQNQTISKESNFVEKSPNMSVEKNELSSNLGYFSLKTLEDSNFASGESECEFSTSARTMLNENDISYDSGMSPLLSSLNVKEKTLKTENSSLSSEIFVNVAHSAEAEAYSTKQSSQTYPQIKAKSDVSLTANRRTEDLNVNLYPRRSLSFLTRHDSLARIQRTLHQSHIKMVHVQHDNKDKFAENKLQFVNRSKSAVPSQRTSIKSCIPISKNRLEPIRRARHQTHARSPTRGPLTVSCREKTFSKTEDEKITQKRSTPIINRHLHVKEMALDLIELDVQKDTFAKDLERTDKADTAYRDSDATSQENSKLLTNELVNTNSSAIEREHSKNFTDGNKSDTKIIERGNATHKTVAIISIMADENVRKNCPVSSFILKTEKICSATDFLRHNNKLWAVTIEKTEKEVTAKPSITDTCTSMSEIVLKTN